MKIKAKLRRLSVLFLGVVLSFTSFAQYTLQDSDVSIEDGVIQSCSYAGGENHLIIPDQLSGQVVLGFADDYTNDGVFANMGLVQVELPAGLQYIGEYAFFGNVIETIDFSQCQNLQTIGVGAFHSNHLTEVDLSSNANLRSIGSTAFFTQAGEGLSSVDLSNCTSLERIGSSAFSGNEISALSLSACTSLTEIGIGAFSSNQLSLVNLSTCSALMSIAQYAFYNNQLTGFSLPVNVQYNEFGWEDGNGNLYEGGDFVTDFLTEYWVPVTYVVQSQDVTIVDGVILEFVYDYEETSITIPETLQGQTVIGIADMTDEGVFESKGITEVNFPANMQFIGDRAFKGNSIALLDLSHCTEFQRFGKMSFQSNAIAEIQLSCQETLEEIDDYAFSYNELGHVDFTDFVALSRIGNYAFLNNFDGYTSELYLNNCVSLDTIGNMAFEMNYFTSIDFTGCSSLRYIGSGAFFQNSISELDLSPLTSLEVIDVQAFSHNSISSVDVSSCESLYRIGYWAFSNNPDLEQFFLPANPGMNPYFWRGEDDNTYSAEDAISNFESEYVMPVYVLKDEDVTMSNGYITACHVDFPVDRTYLIFPDVLDNQPVWGVAHGDYYSGASHGVFEGKDIERVFFNSEIKLIGDYAFKDNVITSLPLGAYANLLQIGVEAFASNLLTLLDVNAYSLTVIDDYAFHNNQLTDVNLNAASDLKMIGDYAFAVNSISSLTLNSADQLQYIGQYAFALNSIVNFVLPTPDVAGYNFNQWQGTNSSTYAGGATANNLNIGYVANLTSIGNSLTFTISDGISPIESAFVSLETYGIRQTNAAGQVTFESVEDYQYNYTVSAFNFDSNSGSITMSGANQVENVVLNASVYDVRLNLFDGETALTGVEVTFDGSNYLSNGSGYVLVQDVVPGTYDFSVNDESYLSFNSTINVVAVDIEQDIQLTRVYAVNFTVTDGLNPIEGANVSFDGDEFVTNSGGNLVVSGLSEGVYNYSVSKDGYSTVEQLVTVSDDDVNLSVEMVPVYELEFQVSDGLNPISEATIYLNGNAYQSDVNGQLVFDDLEAGLYEYTVTSDGYSSVSDDINLTENEIIQVELVLVYDVEFYVTDGSLPLENAEIEMDGVTLNTNYAGFVTFEDVPEGTYTYYISANGYEDMSAVIHVEENMLEMVSLSPVGIVQLMEHKVSVYPNPTSGNVNVAGLEHDASVEVLNAFGQLLVRFDCNQDLSFDLSDFPAGVYMLRFCFEDNQTFIKRIVKE